MIDRLRARWMAWSSRSPAAGNVARMLVGNASAQALTLLAYPVLTRLYPPADFGVLAALGSALTILAPMAALRLELALPIARSAREAASVLALCGMALAGTTLLVALALAGMPAGWFGPDPQIATYRWFLPLALLAFGGYVVLVYEATRQDRFADIARTRVLQAFGGPLCQIGLGLAGTGSIGLLIGFIVGQSSGTLGLARRVLAAPGAARHRVTWRSVRAAAARHRRFALYSSWTGVVSAAGNYVMTIAFTVIYGPAIGGFMFLGERVLMRPLLLITNAVLPVFTREVAQALQNDRPRVPRLFIGVVKKQALLSLAWVVPIVLAAPYLIGPAFGAQWSEAAHYVQVLAVGYLPTSVLHPVLHTLQVMREQKLSAALDLARSAAVFSAIGAAGMMGLPALGAVLLCSCVQAACQFIVLWVIWRRVQVLGDGHGPPAPGGTVNGAA